jgi:hypothetical protein
MRTYTQDAGMDENVEIDWYLPPSEKTSETAAVSLVCNGGFDSNSMAPLSVKTPVR